MGNQCVYLPWLRRGLAKHITGADTLSDSAVLEHHAQIKVEVNVVADGADQPAISQTIQLAGPGDIVGIDKSAIVKTEPAKGVINFEPNFFPYIEFFEEDFLWRYTPAAPANETRLRPWIAVLAMEDHEYQRIAGVVKGIEVIRVHPLSAGGVLPPLEQSWAWAHVQINNDQFTVTELLNAELRNAKVAASLNQHPNLGLSRLICPRKLKPNTKYTCFLVPAFEKGRLAGIGASRAEIDAVSRLKPAWINDSDTAIDLPVYHEWNFRTGNEDFELLVNKIKPQDITGTDIGKLWIDVSDINYGASFDYHGNAEAGVPARKGMMPFQGALVVPGNLPVPLTSRQTTDEKDFVKRFATLINLGVQYRLSQKDQLPASGLISENEDDDPLLMPPVYGRWYANPDGTAVLNPQQPGNWLEQLNLDPAFRVAAGLGAEVVKENQEDFVSRAWEQFSERRKTLNRELQLLRFGQEVTNATYKKHFVGAAPGNAAASNRLLALTQTLHPLVKSDTTGVSVAGTLSNFKPDAAFVQPAYRRITRTQGPLMKRNSIRNSYKLVMVAPTKPFFMFAFVFNANPPFQNFDNAKLATFNTANLISINIRILSNFTILPVPAWFNATNETFITTLGKFGSLIQSLQETVMRKPILRQPDPVDLGLLTAKMQAKILPATSFRAKLMAKLPSGIPASIAGGEVISPNSFNPYFNDATYELLARLRKELFIPNLEVIKDNSCVLLQSNASFIESFLVGMNHELAAEFLWRGFPSDLNATYFRRFWDKSDVESGSVDNSDIEYIRRWKPGNKIGSNAPPGNMTDPLVFVMKAELVKKYPNLVVYAQKAKFNPGTNIRVPDTTHQPMMPVFLSNMEPDFLFAGFTLTREAVMAADGGYYFVIAERPGEVHFGLDQIRETSFGTWNDFAWSDLGEVDDYIDLQKNILVEPTDKKGLSWGKGEQPLTADPAKGSGDSAQMAAILVQRPVRMFVHASVLVK